MASLTIEHSTQVAANSHSTVPRVLTYHPTVRDSDERLIDDHGAALPTAAYRRIRQYAIVPRLCIPRSAATLSPDSFFCSIIQPTSRAYVQHGVCMCSSVSADTRQAGR